MNEFSEVAARMAKFLDEYGEFFPLVLFVSFFLFIMPLIAKMGGWSALAQCYGTPQASSGMGKRLRFRSAQLRGHTNYGNCLTFAADMFGLHISTFLLFRLGHPPLFIPWQDITAREVRAWLVPAVELRFAKAPQIPMRISRRLAEELFVDVGSSVQILPAE